MIYICTELRALSFSVLWLCLAVFI